MTRVLIAGAVVLGLVAVAALLPVGPTEVTALPAGARPSGPDLSGFSAEQPGRPIHVLFIHHSCGGQLLAAPGPDVGEACIYETHPNGGDLRRRLREAGYVVNEASYASVVGDRTDMFDWPAKFTSQVDRILVTRRQDVALPAGERNHVVMFKSCYPNSDFVGEGTEPGRAEGPDLTLANARAALRALLPTFAAHPDTLFVYVTAPPQAPKLPRQAAWKWVLKRVLKRGLTPEVLAQRGALARRFNDWVVAPEGWLAGYPGSNVVAFDYHDVLTGRGASVLSRYPSGDGTDSHPSAEGNARAAAELVPLLNRAVRRAGLVN